MLPRKKTDEELKELALGLDHGKYFSSAHCASMNEISMVFMPLMFMTDEGLAELEKQEVCFFYEEISKASPRAIDGKPTFFSIQTLNIADYEKLMELHKQIKEALAAI